MDNSIKLMVEEMLLEKDMCEKVVTIDVGKGEVRLEIPDKVLAEGGKKLGELIRTIKYLTGEAHNWTIL